MSSSSHSGRRQRHSGLSAPSSPVVRGIPIATVLDRLFAQPKVRVATPSAPKILERRVTAAPATRALTLQPSSWNPETRTVDVIWTTGSRGTRYSWDTGEVVDEELATGPNNVRLDRLNRGAPVLNTHQKDDLGAQIGTVVPGSARMADGQGIATLKLSDRPDVAPIVADIAAGIIRNLSVGYAVHVFEVDLKASPRPLYRAIDWEPTEISFVPVPFDIGAQVRDLRDTSGTPCLIRTIASKESKKMNMSWLNRFTRGRSPAGTGQTSIEDTDEFPTPSYDRQASIKWIRDYTRMAQSSFDMPADLCADLALEFAERQLSEGDARDAMAHIVSQRQAEATRGLSGGGGGGGGSASPSPAGNALIFGQRSYDDPQFHASAVEDALLARMSGKPPTEQARQFMSMSMVQIAGELLTRSGVRNVNRMDATDVLNAAGWNSGGGSRSYMQQRDSGGYHTTSDFPQLMLGAGQRYLLEVYQAVESPLKKVSRQRSARDFREISGLELSGFGTLDETPEAGEIKYGSFKARAETYRLRTFTKGFKLSMQSMVNDDLGAFADPMVLMARTAAETEATLLAELVQRNPVMGDGIPLFDVRHGNLAVEGAPPSVDTIDLGRQSMRGQKGLDGTAIAPTPRHLIVGTALETIADTLANTPNVPDATGKILIANPFAGKLQSGVDPRLAPRAWYLFGDPASAPTLEHAYLNDKTGPSVEQREGWNVLGTEFRVYMHFGAGAVDYRGAYKNPGAVVA